MGGLGIVGGLLGLGGSASGGLGTAALVTVSGSASSYFLFRSRVRSDYHIMLEDLLKVYTGVVPTSMSELKLEESLLAAAANFNINLATGKIRRTNIAMFDQYDDVSKQRFNKVINWIDAIHEIKKERLRGTIMTVCGPRDSGKTTLVSQLLQKPALVFSTGFQGGEQETRHVIPHPISNIPLHVLLDTPGLTGPEENVRDSFVTGALNLSSTFIYVREYNGLPTSVDLDVVCRILKCAARTKPPSILICLNRCKTKLTEDAAGEIDDLTAKGEKKAWLKRLNELRSQGNSSFSLWVNQLFNRCDITVEFVELNGDKELEDTFKKDFSLDGIWTCSSIGQWLSDVTKPKDDVRSKHWSMFDDHMKNFRYRRWQEGVRESRELRRRERKEEEQRESDRRELMANIM